MKIVFTIDDVAYPFDTDDGLTMDEAIILQDYAGLTLDQLDEDVGFNPKVIAAFMHIGIARKEPDLRSAQVRKRVGAVKISDLDEAFGEAVEKAAQESKASSPLVPSASGSSENDSASGSSSGDGSPNDGVDSPEPSDPERFGSPD